MPTCTHTQVMMVLAVWQIAGPCTFDLLPCLVCSIASPKGFILTSHPGAALSCCHFGYPAYLCISKDPPCSHPWGYSVSTATAGRAQFCTRPCLRIQYFTIFLSRNVNFVLVVERAASKPSAEYLAFAFVPEYSSYIRLQSWNLHLCTVKLFWTSSESLWTN